VSLDQLKLIPFRARHVKEIYPEAPEAMLEIGELAQDCSGYALTACYLGQPIGAGGIVVQRPGVADAWTLFTPMLKTLPFFLHRTVKIELCTVIKKFNLRRIQCTIEMTDESHTACKWAKSLGFQYEGTMRSYTHDGKNVYLFALIPNEVSYELSTCGASVHRGGRFAT
jgi:hypothetical protein